MNKLTVYDLISYLFKHKWFLILFVVIFTLCGFFVINKTQTYTAQAVIRFTEINTSDGYTVQGNKLDVYEIISPRVVSEAIQTLGVDEKVEDVRSNCTIIGIIPSDVQALKEANQKEGIEFDYYPKDYTISYTADSDKSSEYARDMVDAILTAYTSYYSDTYLSTYNLPEIEFESLGESDYLEMTEVIESAIEDAAAYFNRTVTNFSDFRSPRTGYSFSNMSNMYSQIKDVTLPTIFSKILSARLTKDKDVLLKTYEYKVQKATLNYETKNRDSLTAANLMNSFVEANKTVPSSYGAGDDDDEKYHAYEVYEVGEDGVNPQDTTYDDLINKYVVDGVSAGEYLIDCEYYQNIIDIYKTDPPANTDVDQITKEVEEALAETTAEVSELYEITNMFTSDFKRYQLTKNINLLTSITTKGNNPVNLFRGLVFVMVVLIGCVAVIAYEIIMLTKKKKKNEE